MSLSRHLPLLVYASLATMAMHSSVLRGQAEDEGVDFGDEVDTGEAYPRGPSAAGAMDLWEITPTPTPTPSPSPTPTPTNGAPQVVLTVPTNGQIFVAGTDIPLAATASDADGTVTKVDFFRNGTLIGTDTSAP